MRPGMIIYVTWAAFALSWVAAAGWSSTTQKSVGMKREVGYRSMMLLGGIVMLIPAHGYEGPLRLWHVGFVQVWACIGAIAAGFAFSWWARVHLGALWSGQITTKQAHRVVDTGPYRIVRHPIYTGILLAVYATAAAKGTIPGVAGALLVTVGVWMKARLEERWLSAELGGEAYGLYQRRVPMLIPFGPAAKR